MDRVSTQEEAQALLDAFAQIGSDTVAATGFTVNQFDEVHDFHLPSNRAEWINADLPPGMPFRHETVRLRGLAVILKLIEEGRSLEPWTRATNHQKETLFFTRESDIEIARILIMRWELARRQERAKRAGAVSPYEVQKLLGGDGGGPAMFALQQTEELLPHHVVLHRNNLPGGGDLGDCQEVVVDYFLATERGGGRWSCWLLGGGIKFAFEDPADAVLARLLLDG
jgi:hypothetical protein